MYWEEIKRTFYIMSGFRNAVEYSTFARAIGFASSKVWWFGNDSIIMGRVNGRWFFILTRNSMVKEENFGFLDDEDA